MHRKESSVSKTSEPYLPAAGIIESERKQTPTSGYKMKKWSDVPHTAFDIWLKRNSPINWSVFNWLTACSKYILNVENLSHLQVKFTISTISVKFLLMVLIVKFGTNYQH